MASGEYTHPLRIFVRPDLYTRFNKLCAAQGISMAAKIRHLIIDCLLQNATDEDEAVAVNMKPARHHTSARHGRWLVTMTLRSGVKGTTFRLPRYDRTLVRNAEAKHSALEGQITLGRFVNGKWHGEVALVSADLSIDAVSFDLKSNVLAAIRERKDIVDARRSSRYIGLDSRGVIGSGCIPTDDSSHTDAEPEA